MKRECNMIGMLHGFLLVSCLSAAAWNDWRTGKIPNQIPLSMLLAGGLLLIFGTVNGVKCSLSAREALEGFLAGGGLFFLCYLFCRGRLGAGDVKLSAAIGFLMGWRKAVTAYILAVALASCACVVLLLCRRTGRKGRIPLAPFLLCGVLGALWM